MSDNSEGKGKFRLVPDWKIKGDKPQKVGSEVHMHPHALIAFTHKKWGIVKAAQLAKGLIKRKYHYLLERSKTKVA